MYYIILSIVLLIVLSFIYYQFTDDAYATFSLSGMIGIIFILLGAFVIPSTTGLVENYSTGIRTGYIVKLSNKGVFWKTKEGELQIGSGDQMSVSGLYAFSVTDTVILKILNDNIGKRVTVTYSQWLIMPYRLGSSGYLITNVKLEK